MNKSITQKKLESYRTNKRLIEKNKKRIEEEKYRDIPVVMGKVKGSSPEFPYIEKNFSVLMDEPIEADKTNRRVIQWKQEIKQAKKEIEEVDNFIAGIEDARDREMLTYRYVDGMKVKEIAKEIGYSHGRVSQIISKYLKV